MAICFQVPGCEDKAGMAAIEEPNKQVDLVGLLNKLRRWHRMPSCFYSIGQEKLKPPELSNCQR